MVWKANEKGLHTYIFRQTDHQQREQREGLRFGKDFGGRVTNAKSATKVTVLPVMQPPNAGCVFWFTGQCCQRRYSTWSIDQYRKKLKSFSLKYRLILCYAIKKQYNVFFKIVYRPFTLKMRFIYVRMSPTIKHILSFLLYFVIVWICDGASYYKVTI